VDILQTDINHVGGVSSLWKAGAIAESAGISMAPHACEGPIGGIATLHVDAAMPNFLVQEVCGGVRPSAQDKVREEWLRFPAMRMVKGRFPLPQKPGLGFELSEAALAKYPFGRVQADGAGLRARRLRGGVVGGYRKVRRPARMGGAQAAKKTANIACARISETRSGHRLNRGRAVMV